MAFRRFPKIWSYTFGRQSYTLRRKIQVMFVVPRGRNWSDLTVKRLTRGPLVARFWLQKRPASQLNLAPGRTSQLVTWAVENASDKIIWCFGRTTHVVRSLQVWSHVAYHFPPRSVSSSSTTLFLAGGPNYPTSTEASRCQSCMVPFSAPST